MLVPLKSVSNVSRFKPAFNLNRVLADLSRGSNSQNSVLGKSVKGLSNDRTYKPEDRQLEITTFYVKISQDPADEYIFKFQ